MTLDTDVKFTSPWYDAPSDGQLYLSFIVESFSAVTSVLQHRDS